MVSMTTICTPLHVNKTTVHINWEQLYTSENKYI